MTRFTCPVHAVPGGTTKFPYRVHSKRAYAAVVVWVDVPLDVGVVVGVVLPVVEALDVGVVLSDDETVVDTVLVPVVVDVGVVEMVDDGVELRLPLLTTSPKRN